MLLTLQGFSTNLPNQRLQNTCKARAPSIHHRKQRLIRGHFGEFGHNLPCRTPHARAWDLMSTSPDPSQMGTDSNVDTISEARMPANNLSKSQQLRGRDSLLTVILRCGANAAGVLLPQHCHRRGNSYAIFILQPWSGPVGFAFSRRVHILGEVATGDIQSCK